MSHSQLPDRFAALDQVNGRWCTTALKFEYQKDGSPGLTSERSVWMTLRSGLHRLFKGDKSIDDRKTNQDSINAVLDYIRDQADEGVRDYVKKQLASLRGDPKGSKFTVAKRLARGSYVSKALILRMKDLAIKGMEEMELARLAASQTLGSPTLTAARLNDDGSETSEEAGDADPPKPLRMPSLEISTAASDCPSDDVADSQGSLTQLPVLSRDGDGNDSFYSMVIHSKVDDEDAMPPIRSGGEVINTPNIRFDAIDLYGHQRTPSAVDASGLLPGMYDLIIKSVLYELQIPQLLKHQLFPLLEDYCHNLQMEARLAAKPGKVDAETHTQQVSAGIEAELRQTVQGIAKTVEDLAVANESALGSARREAVEAAGRALIALSGSIVPPKEEGDFEGFQEYVDAFVDLAVKSYRYTCLRHSVEDPSRPSPTEGACVSDLKALLQESQSELLKQGKPLADQWSGAEWFDELAFGLGFLEAQDQAISQKNAPLARLGNRQISLDEMSELMNEVDDEVAAQQDASFVAPASKAPLVDIEPSATGTETYGDSTFPDTFVGAGNVAAPYLAVRRCMAQAAVALSKDKVSAAREVDKALLGWRNDAFDYNTEQVLITPGGDLDADALGADGSDEFVPTLRPELLSAYSNRLRWLGAVMRWVELGGTPGGD